MLKLLHSIKTVSFSDLMQVYSQSIAESGAIHYPNMDAYSRSLEAEQDFYNYLQIFFKTPGAYMGVWVEESRYVSVVRVEPFRDGMLISGLETAPDQCGMGYATALLSSITSASTSQCIKFYSHVLKRNAASLAVHKNAGFSILFEDAHYMDGSVDHRSYTLLKINM